MTKPLSNVGTNVGPALIQAKCTAGELCKNLYAGGMHLLFAGMVAVF